MTVPVAKGTPLVIGAQIGDVFPHKATFSEKGWSTNETISNILIISNLCMMIMMKFMLY